MLLLSRLSASREARTPPAVRSSLGPDQGLPLARSDAEQPVRLQGSRGHLADPAAYLTSLSYAICT